MLRRAASILGLVPAVALSCNGGSAPPIADEAALTAPAARGLPAAAHQRTSAAEPRLSADAMVGRSAAVATTVTVDGAWRRRLCDDRSAALRDLRLVPLASDGSMSRAVEPWAGVRIFGVRGGSTAAKLGLQNGDGVWGVDEIPLDSPESGEAAADRLCARTGVTVHLLPRAGTDGGAVDLVWRVAAADRD